MSDVFISYQRKQEVFVRALQQRFEAVGKDVWVDLDDIPKAADWLQQIERGIEGATCFVCVLTLDYVISEICSEELVHARLHKKQIIPIVRDIDPKAVPEVLRGLRWEAEATENWDVLRALNWIFFRESDDFEKAFHDLFTATETDLAFEELRARLTIRAHEWVNRNRNTSYVLRGSDLLEAERWLSQSSTKKLGPSAEQFEYITSSRRAATARQRVTVGALSAGLLIATILAIVAILNGNRAQANFLGSESQRLAIAANAALQTDNFDLATLLGIRAMRTSYSEGAEVTLSQAMAQTAGTIFRGHPGAIDSIAYSPNGQYGLTASEDGTVRLWQIATGKELRRFLTGTRSVSFSPDGRYALTGGENGTVQLWDIETSQMTREFKGHTQAVLSVAYSPDGVYILTGSADRTARLWDASTGQQIRAFDQQPDNVASVESVAFAADGRYALTARGWNGDMFDGSARVWDVATGQVLRVFSGQGAALTSIAYSPAPNGYVLTSGYDHKARLWDWFSGQAVQVFSGNSLSVIYATVSPDGTRVLTGGDGILWDANTGVLLRRLTEDGIAVQHAAFSPDGRYVFGSIGDHARLWDLNTGPELRRVTSTASPQSHATFSADGQTILTVDANHSVSLRDLTSNTVKMQFPSSTAIDARFSPDGQYIYTT
ncbi:MAG: toll/interleukin-1 receptor domain-containing protein [Aggregatilineales bacterium]